MTAAWFMPSKGGDLKLTGDAKGTLVFQGQTADGRSISKSFTFTGATYPIQFDVSVKTAAGTRRFRQF